MKRITGLMSLALLLSLPMAGCNNKDKGSTENPDAAAEEDGDPLEALKGIPDEIQAEVDNVLQPINDVDVVVEQVTTIPTRYNLDAAAITGLAKAKMDAEGNASVEIDLDVTDEARAEIETLLSTLDGIKVGIQELPQRSTQATKNIAALGVKATGLVTQLQTKYQAKLASPFTKAEEKAQIQADLDAVLKLDADIKTIIADAKSTVTGLPAKGTEAMAKLTAAFAGGASAGE